MQINGGGTLFFRALWTKAFQYIVDTFQLKAIWQLHGRHLNLFQTECTVTTRAIEMGVLFLIVVVVFTVVVADVVFQRPAAVIHCMY